MNQCCAKVFPGNGWRPHQCSRNGVVEHEGKFYCRQHSPEAMQKRKEASKAKYDAHFEKLKADIRLKEMQAKSLKIVRQIAAGHNDPRTLAVEFLASFGEAPANAE